MLSILQCWKSRVRDGYGVERVSRGCTTSHDQLPLLCNQNYNINGGPRKRHTSGQYNIECCTGDYCNNGSFPELPPIHFSKPNIERTKCRHNVDNIFFSLLCADEVTKVVDTSSSVFYMKLLSAIIGPFLVLSCIALFVIYFIRRKHYKRATRSKQQDPETYYASEPVTVGDSTLRVSYVMQYWCKAKTTPYIQFQRPYSQIPSTQSPYTPSPYK